LYNRRRGDAASAPSQVGVWPISPRALRRRSPATARPIAQVANTAASEEPVSVILSRFGRLHVPIKASARPHKHTTTPTTSVIPPAPLLALLVCPAKYSTTTQLPASTFANRCDSPSEAKVARGLNVERAAGDPSRYWFTRAARHGVTESGTSSSTRREAHSQRNRLRSFAINGPRSNGLWAMNDFPRTTSWTERDLRRRKN